MSEHGDGASPVTALERVLARLHEDTGAETGERFVAIASEYMRSYGSGHGPVSTGRSSSTIATRFDEPLPSGGAPIEHILERFAGEVLSDANHLMHPSYMGHQVSPPLAAAIWTDLLVSALNQSVAVAEMSPTATPVEHRVIRWLCDAAGFGHLAGGTMTSGGTEATITALLAARARKLPRAWEDGVGANPPVVLCGEHAHYSTRRAVAQLGLGMRNAIAVPSDGLRMSVAALREMLDHLVGEGREVLAVVATAGSTATGSFDDVDAIARACEERDVWLHVDGAHGATALLSERHRHRLRGVERAHSLSWDAHKLMLMPLPAGVLLVREERLLERAFVQSAPYLFHGDEDGRIWDQGVRSLLCSRRADALKLWVALQRYGVDGVAALHDHLVDVTRTLWEEIGVRGDFVTAHEPESNILCFRWIGNGRSDRSALDDRNRLLRERYNRSGQGWITTTVLNDTRWLRVTIMNPRTGREHVRALLTELSRLAAAMDG